MSQWTRSGAGEAYDSARPPWPHTIREFLGSLAPPGGWKLAVDLAAGTGKLTEQLIGLARRVVAVEPSEAQLSVLAERIPEASALTGTAEAIPLPDASADLLVAGNAWHWFDPVPAAAEARRVLRPGGVVASLWYFPQWPEWFGELWEALADYRNAAAETAVKRAREGAWRSALEEHFGPLESRDLGRTELAYSPEEFLRMFATIGFVAALDDGRRAEAVACARRFIAGRGDVIPAPHLLQAVWACDRAPRVRVLLTGMSGTGKSTLVEELRRRGHRAFDADDHGFSEPRDDGRWGWRRDAVAELLEQEDADVLFFAGCSEEQVDLPFDFRVLLTAPAPVLAERLRTRSPNGYGRSPSELAQVLADQAAVEPLLRRSADLELTSTAPVDQLADDLLAWVGAASGTPQGRSG